jgi:hypothetical protein
MLRIPIIKIVSKKKKSLILTGSEIFNIPGIYRMVDEEDVRVIILPIEERKILGCDAYQVDNIGSNKEKVYICHKKNCGPIDEYSGPISWKKGTKFVKTDEEAHIIFTFELSI